MTSKSPDADADLTTDADVSPVVPASSPKNSTSHWRIAAAFAIPYLILMLAWVFSNPPGASPDEPDHLVKAIGMARFDIGTQYRRPPVGGGGIGQQRNASISRVIAVPANVAPKGYLCESFRPTVTAACLPSKPPSSTAPTNYIDPLGSYPPFLYVPIGWATLLATTPTHAFLLARVFCAFACSLLLLLGAAHLVRELGARALLGAFVGLTPMVVFCGGAVTTSGIEICAAFATSCIVVAGLRRPTGLTEPGTQFLLAGVGATLILSRQLGVVTFGVMMILLIVRIGPRFFLKLAKARSPAFLCSVGILLVAALAVAAWERLFDHPSMVGAPFSAGALGSFAKQSYGVVRSGVAQFGWLDTLIPPWFIAGWIVLCIVLVGTAALVGRRGDSVTLLLWTVVMIAVGFFTYATVFFPVKAGLQGRHLLAFFIFLPLLSGVMIVERMSKNAPDALRRIFVAVTIVMPLLQVVSLYMNARRYAIGSAGPVWFFSAAQWHPRLGWTPWLLLGLLGGVMLGRSILSSSGTDQQKVDRKGRALVER